MIIVSALAIPAGDGLARQVVLYGFENDPQGWEIPDWAMEKKDHVARQLSISELQASEGTCSLEVNADFIGTCWEGVYIEKLCDVTDWSPFNYLSIDIYLPKNAPRGLRARVVLTIGDGWRWTEMNRTVPLTPGEWSVIKADLTPKSMNWRCFVDDSFRADVRKLGIRIESNGKVNYNGPVYIDNIKLSE